LNPKSYDFDHRRRSLENEIEAKAASFPPPEKISNLENP
jgi:hypothetical protein